jgi:hypothetical protein
MPSLPDDHRASGTGSSVPSPRAQRTTKVAAAPTRMVVLFGVATSEMDDVACSRSGPDSDEPQAGRAIRAKAKK